MSRSTYSSFTVNDGSFDNSTVAASVAFMMPKQPVFCVLVSVQATIGMYLLIAMIYDEWKHRKPPTTSTQMHAKRLRKVSLFLTCVGAAHLIINVIAVFSPATESSCTVRQAVQKLSYCLGMFGVYAFLWLRQKLFYSNPSLKYLYSRVLRICSWCVFAIILLCFICQCVMTVLGVIFVDQGETISSDMLCFNTQKRIWTIQITLAAVTSSLVHISLMCLFIYPLCKHRLQTSNFFVRNHNGSFVSRSSLQNPTQTQEDGTLTRKTSNSLLRDNIRRIYQYDNDDNTYGAKQDSNDAKTPLTIRRSTSLRHPSQTQAPNVSDKLRNLIKRCLLLTITCVIASIAVTVLTAAFFRGGLLATFLYGMNMIINMTCCSGCFNDWRATLFPFCFSSKKRKTSERSESVKHSPHENNSQRLARQYDSIV